MKKMQETMQETRWTSARWTGAEEMGFCVVLLMLAGCCGCAAWVAWYCYEDMLAGYAATVLGTLLLLRAARHAHRARLLDEEEARWREREWQRWADEVGRRGVVKR